MMEISTFFMIAISIGFAYMLVNSVSIWVKE